MFRRLVVLATVLTACSSSGSDVNEPTTGGVSVTLTTTGANPDPDGYLLSIDGNTPLPIPDNGSYTADGFAVGSHTVQLSGLAENCTVQGDNPRTITIVAGDTTAVTATIDCPTPAPTTGTIQVKTRRIGTGDDIDGYTIKLDNGPRQVIVTITDEFFYRDVTPGVHSLNLGGMATFCTLEGANPRTVTVVPGETVTVTFRVICIAPPANHPPTISQPAGVDVYTTMNRAVDGVVFHGAFDEDGDALTEVIARPPANGQLVSNGNGTYSYTPQEDFHGADSFEWRVKDSKGA